MAWIFRGNKLDNITKNNRLFWIDIIRIIAIIAVVAIHVEDSFIFYWNKIPLTDWWASNIYNGFIRFPVPIFLILSGYLLLDKQEDDKIFFSKRFSKVVIPLVAWSMIYWVFKNNYNVLSLFTVSFVQQLFANKIYFHLYFLYVIIGLYLITPLLRRILVHASAYDVRYYLVLWLFFVPISSLLGLLGYRNGIPLVAATWDFGFFFIGYVIKKTRITKKIVYLSSLLVIVSIVVTIIGTYYLTGRSENFYGSVHVLFAITSVTYSPCLFILIQAIFSRFSVGIGSASGKLINAIGRATMGIYLVHPMLLHFIVHGVSGIRLLSVKVLSPIVSIPLVTFLLVVLSFIIVLILQKVPLLKKIVP